MTIILSDNNSLGFLWPPRPTPGRVEGGGNCLKLLPLCIFWEKEMTIKMRLSKIMLFFLCFRPTIEFQDGSPVDALLDPPADPPPFHSTSQKIFLSSFRRLLFWRTNVQ